MVTADKAPFGACATMCPGVAPVPPHSSGESQQDVEMTWERLVHFCKTHDKIWECNLFLDYLRSLSLSLSFHYFRLACKHDGDLHAES